MMSSRFHCAVDITAKFIDAATKQHGGRRSALIHWGWQTFCGAKHIRSRDSGFALERWVIASTGRFAAAVTFSSNSSELSTKLMP